MSTIKYVEGQRWISDAEPELGLGTLIKHEGRTITLLFPASGESRIYAIDNAPVTRVVLQPGDITEDRDGTILKIVSARGENGLYVYTVLNQDGTETDLAEELLSNFLQFNRPQERLLNGLIDDNHWFDLRCRTIEQQQQHAQSDLIGLGGARIDLLPHQLYIAHEVGKRLAPRVLLADEVGLGKTIEACLILHRQLLTGNANRALIVVPEPLLHQWLVELVRRFNLKFSLFDEERCRAIVESGQADNPFQAEQLVICSLDLLTDSQQRLKQALDANWDILIVDEAHHLEWHEDGPSVAYQCIETLARRIPGVLLLTATPEQLGRTGHFARLRLLDPSRFHSLEAFLLEQEQYQPVAEAAQQLLSDNQLSEQQIETVSQLLQHDHASQLLEKLHGNNGSDKQEVAVREQLIDMLLDRHGTGRVLFRNTRNRIKGFSRRNFHSYPLEYPNEYQDRVIQDSPNPLQLLYPETVYSNSDSNPWWQFDPRVDWLIQKLRELADEKVLLICSSANTAMELEQALRQSEGIAAALFHEHRSIIERDRAAAWFADAEQGCQILICSEIGSEGRNFQFAHHLILFDLPANPDLLEQRIGRLDRIGQRHTIQLHAPYFKDSAQEVILNWYNLGLNAFEHTCAPGQQIFKQQLPALTQAMLDAGNSQTAIDELITTTRQLHQETIHKLEQGRDHLLELNSCRMQQAEDIKHSLEDVDSSKLHSFMDDLLDAFNLDVEFHTKQSQIVKPGQHMQVEHFPNLPADGVTVTYQRQSALAHEDWQFLTWEHPMVLDAMEMLLERENGNSCATAIRHPDIASNSIYLELLFVLECPAPRSLQAGRFLPPTLIRTVMDQKGTDQSKLLTPDTITHSTQHLEKNITRKLIKPLRPLIQSMLSQGESRAQAISSELVPNAINRMAVTYDLEIERMLSLQEVNPNIKPEEIEIMRKHKTQLETHIASSKIRLDAVRFIVAL
jgi:ATP-dependent helicase HepA